MNSNHYKHISHDERILIVDDFKSGYSWAAIARRRKRHCTTIKRVIEKCRMEDFIKVKGDWYEKQMIINPNRGDLIYKLNSQKCIKPRKIHDGTNLVMYIRDMMKRYKSSPYDMLQKLDDKMFDLNTGHFLDMTYRERYNLGNVDISESTIYNAIHSPKVQTIKPYMMIFQYRRGKQYVFKEGKRTNGDSIDLMRKELLDRDLDCVWEGDTVVGKKRSKPVLLTLTNRKNNDEIILKIPDRTKPSVVQGLNVLEQRLGTDKFNDIFNVIIFDNGVEFRDVNGIENSCIQTNIKRTKIYFARPYRSNDRAINENNNRIVRKYFDKGTDFSKITDKQIWIANMLINLTHRKRLNGMNSYETRSIISMSNLKSCTWN